MSFNSSVFKLISETSTNLPSDVRTLIKCAYDSEEGGSLSKIALDTITKNIDIAKTKSKPICQDTGMPTFLVSVPRDFDEEYLEKIIKDEVKNATEKGLLRPNSVDSLTGKNSGNNLGPGTPVIHFRKTNESDVTIRLALKGGGSENVSTQFSLPMEVPGMGRANRDLEGVWKVVLHAVEKAQGEGCSPGYLGICIGGDRANGYAYAKEQLFRPVYDRNPIPELAKLEDKIVADCNRLGIGTLGFGGRTTIMGAKIGILNRLPACFFVSIAYQCWAFRRLGIILDAKSGEIKRWLYRDENEIKTLAQKENITLSGKEIILTPPISEEEVRKIRVGDIVIISGQIHTGRDEIHKYLVSNDVHLNLNGHVIYHCGPVMIKDKSGNWKVAAAGPTTSIREEPYEAEVIRKYGIRAIIGKGGMGEKTLNALKEFGAVYLTAVGGAAQIYAEMLPEVEGVDFLDKFGVPEAMWHYKANNFSTICTMDSTLNSLHKTVSSSSKRELEKIHW